jgi:proteasome-associated ATPase
MSPPRAESERSFQRKIQELISQIDGPQSIQTVALQFERLRRDLSPLAPAIDQMLLTTLLDLRAGLEEATGTLQELSAEVEKLSSPPWSIGRVQAMVEDEGRAIVQTRAGQTLVELAADVEPSDLGVGTAVYVSQSGSLVMGCAPESLLAGGETAYFDRALADGRAVVKYRDEEFVVSPSSSIDARLLKEGDMVMWDRGMHIALEQIEPGESKALVKDEGLGVSFDDVGGLGGSVRQLVSAVTTGVVDSKLAATYGIDGRRTVLMCGPPGCGKTLIAKATAREIEALTGRKCHFFVVKPGEWETAWVGETQANIRRTFETLNAQAKGDVVVLFLDEVESLGRHRGATASTISDKFTAALLAELDGFSARGESVIMAATNRKDLIDSALLQRLSEVEIAIPRPDADGAREIFSIHLGEKIPVRPNGPLASSTRSAILDAAVAQLYTENGDADLCTLHFRDGQSRSVRASEMVSGRLIRQICRSAAEAACQRELDGGPAGLQVADVNTAVGRAVQGLSTTLTCANAREYLKDLPQDVDVVRIDRVTRRVHQPLRYINPE